MKRLNRLEIDSVLEPIFTKIKKDREVRQAAWLAKLNSAPFEKAAKLIKQIPKEVGFIFDGDYTSGTETNLVKLLKEQYAEINYVEKISYKSLRTIEHEIVRLAPNCKTLEEIENSILILNK